MLALSNATAATVQTNGASAPSVVVSFEDYTAIGLRLKDVLSTNPDGTTNNCSSRPSPVPKCCDGMPPFEVLETSKAGTSWVRVARDKISIAGSSVTLTTSSATVAPMQVCF